MKTRIIEMIGVLATVWCLALTGCDMGNTPDVQPTGAKRTVRIIISTGAESLSQTNSRTVGPWNPNFAYMLTFTAEGKPSVVTTLIGNTGEVLLFEGIWTLNVIGWQSGPTLAESDPVTVAVSAEGDPPTISVPMHPVLDGEAGTFSCYIISYSADITEVSAVLTPRNVGNAEQSEIALDIEAGENTVSVAPGYYRLTLRAMKGTQPLIRREVVHIYSSTQTYVSYYLTEADFAPAIYLGGTITNGFEGYHPVAVIAYEDAEGSVFIDESAVTDGVWKMEVEGTLVYCKVRLEKDGAVYYGKPTLVSGFPVSGKTDFVLPIEGYTVTFDANGGFFEGGASTITMTALENETLTPPPAPQGEREFTGWYSAGKSFTAETRITDATTAVYAGWLIGFADIADYLANTSRGNSSANPIPLALNSDLANGGWEAILSTIDAAGKYAALDLSACTMNGTEFDPGTGVGADRVTALVLPDAAKSIKAGIGGNNTYTASFKAFTVLKSLSGAGIETVGGYAFCWCKSLTEVSLPAATTIGNDAFYVCESLVKVSLPAATTIGNDAFGWCESLTEVNLPVVTTIGGGAFAGCESLMEVNLPAATTIGNDAFCWCESLTEVNLPVVATIGNWVFAGCPNLTAIIIDPANTAFTIRGGMLLNKAETTLIAYPSATGAITLPSVTEIGGGAFSGTSLASVSLPAATTIGASAFSYCDSLETVSLPAATTIGASAFFSCDSLETVSLPAAQTIGDGAFNACDSLETVSLPVATSIGYYMFRYCTSLTEVSLPAATTIGNWAFQFCRSLMSVSLPVATRISQEAFHDCTSLTTVSLPAATDILYHAFDGCTSLTTVSLPAAMDIYDGAFYGCTNLTSVSLPSAIYIGLSTSFFYKGVFYACTSLTEVSLPVATYIAGYAFSGCASLTTVSLPAAQTIGDGAFSYCTKLTTVNLPAAQTIGDGAFSDCTTLTTMSLPATPPAIGSIFSYTSSDGTITVSVPTGAVSAYTSTWGVDASTPAGGNTSVYGSYHKAIIITDAAQ
jgi:hypothetical protein